LFDDVSVPCIEGWVRRVYSRKRVSWRYLILVLGIGFLLILIEQYSPGPFGIACAESVVKTIPVGDNPDSVGVNSTTNKAYVTNFNENTVSVIAGGTDSVIKTVSVGNAPLGVGINAITNKIYVCSRNSDAVFVIDGSSDTVIANIPVGHFPTSVAVNNLANKVYVSDTGSAGSPGNTVTVIDGATGSVVKTIGVGSMPQSLAYDRSRNQVVVVNGGNHILSAINCATDSVMKSVALANSLGSLSMNPLTGKLYVSEVAGSILVLDAGSFDQIQKLQVVSPVSCICTNEVTNRVYATNHDDGEVTIVDGLKDTIQAEVRVGGLPVGIDVNPNTHKVYVANSSDNTVSVMLDPPYPTFYFAEGTCRPGFDPYICIENPGTSTAAVKITYMTGDGKTKEQKRNVAPHSRDTALPADILGIGDDAAHDFSAKVECTNGQQIIAERPMYFNYQGKWTGGHDVIGATEPYSRFFFAEGTTRPNFDTYLCLQNPTSTGAAVIIKYIRGSGTNEQQQLVISPHSRLTVNCRDILGTGDDTAHDFSVVIGPGNGPGLPFGQPYVAERPMYFNYNGVWTGGSDTVGATSPASTFYFAEGTTRPEFDTYFSISNQSGSNANVRLTYMRSDGTTAVQNVVVNGRSTVHPADVLGVGEDARHDFSTKVECSNAQILVERPMYFNYNGVWTGGHDVIGTTAPSRTFHFAEGTTRPNFDTYYCIQNPGDGAAKVKITYLKGNGTTQVQTLDVNAHTRSTVVCADVLGRGDNAAHDFSAKVECTNGQQIVAERPMYFNYRGVWTGGHDVVGYQE
jgi:YVTN family beta-propeller protein